MTSTATRLIGRDDLMAELSGSLAGLVAGFGGCTVLEGPAGIGKSRLLSELAAAAAAQNIAIAAGGATTLDRVAPLSTLLRTLRSGDPPVLDEAAIASLPDRKEGRFWLVDRIVELIELYSHETPLTIVVDDAHWADELSSLALRTAVSATRSTPVLWLLARRPAPGRSPAQQSIDWLIEHGARRLCVDPLTEDAVAALGRALLGGMPGPALLHLASGGGGNPFLLEELFTTLRDTGRIVVSGDVLTVPENELPETFVLAANRRIADLSEQTRQLLEAGAVLGRPFTLHEAAGLTGCSPVQLIASVREATEAGVLVPDSGDLTFRHELLREAVYDSLPDPTRTVLHREAATILQAEGRPITETAEHLVRGARRGDAQAVAVLREAAAQLGWSAPGMAADLLLRVLELVDIPDPLRPQLTADVVQLLAVAGRVAQAKAVGEAALASAMPVDAEAAILCGISHALKHAGQDTAVVAYTDRGLALPGLSNAARAALLAVRSHGMLYAGRPDNLAAADSAGASAVDLGETTGEHSAAVFGGVARSGVARIRGDFTAAARLAREAVDLADKVGGEARHHQPRLWLGRALISLDQFAAAEAELELCRRDIDRLGTGWSQPIMHRYRAELRLAQGRLDEAEAEAEAGVQVADQRSATALLPALFAALAQVSLHQGDLTLAEHRLQQAEKQVGAGHGVSPEDLTWIQAQCQLARGDATAAFRTMRPLYESMPTEVPLLALEPAAAAALVRLAHQVGARAYADLVVAGTARLAEQHPDVASLAGAAYHARGLHLSDPDALREAVQAYLASDRPLARATALVDAALTERARGTSGAASDLLTEALDLYLATGATAGAELAQRELDRCATSPTRPHRPRRPRSGWESLTPSELRVVRLVADGLTNREVAARLFLSRHTVDSHLRHAFAKLDISRRVDLTRQVLTAEGGLRPDRPAGSGRGAVVNDPVGSDREAGLW